MAADDGKVVITIDADAAEFEEKLKAINRLRKSGPPWTCLTQNWP